MKNKTVENLLVELTRLQDKIFLDKTVLEDYKIKSDRLTQLTSARKEMSEQIKEEKNRIENEFYQDEVYEKVKNDSRTHKNEVKKKISEIKQATMTMNPEQTIFTIDYNVLGEQLKLQIERRPILYINGKEQK